jgi:hypothetical protein
MSGTDTTSVVRATINNLATFISTNIGMSSPTYTEIFTLIQTYVQENGQIAIPLSNVSVDYETNKAELESMLLSPSNSWQDKVNTGTGETITQLMATILTFNQFAIVRSAQETMIPTAAIDSSIYTGTVFLGVRLTRKIPADNPCSLTRSGDTTSSLEIDPYTQFVAGGVFLFNRDTLIWPSGQATITTDLFEGQTQSLDFNSDGTAYQQYIIGTDDYSISDIDTIVTVNGLQWNRTQFQTYFNIGLWEYGPSDQVFEDESAPDGNVNISFGNGINGQIPTSGSPIVINYIITNGQAGNVDLTAQTVSCTSVQNVTGTITAIAAGGTDEKSASDYKILGPGLFFAKYRAVSRSDQAAIARQYPGVLDAIFLGQQELFPSDLRYAMVTQATLLTNTVWDDADFAAFVLWFSNLNIAQQQVLRLDPTPVTSNITASVYLKPTASSLTAIQNLIIANLQAEFALQAGVLGYSRPISDFGRVIENSDPNVDYYDLSTPNADITVTQTQYFLPGTITLNMAYTTRGTLS